MGKSQIVKTEVKDDVIEINPAKLVELAINNNLDIEKISKLLVFYEKWEKEREEKRIKKEFYTAFTLFQSEIPEIKKSVHVNFRAKSGRIVDYWYEPLAGIIEQLKPYLKKYGLSYQFEPFQEGNKFILTCHMNHISGYSYECTLETTMIVTDKDYMNPIQVLGKIKTYFERYTFCGGFGVATADYDTDGAIPAEYDTNCAIKDKKVNKSLPEKKGEKKIDILKNFTDFNKALIFIKCYEFTSEHNKKEVWQKLMKKAYEGGYLYSKKEDKFLDRNPIMKLIIADIKKYPNLFLKDDAKIMKQECLIAKSYEKLLEIRERITTIIEKAKQDAKEEFENNKLNDVVEEVWEDKTEVKTEQSEIF